MSEPVGPAVTSAFPAATGLHELIGQPGTAPLAPAVTTAAAPPPAPQPTAPPAPKVNIGPELFVNTLTLLDRLASGLLKVDPEPEQVIKEMAGAVTPLAQYYADKGGGGVAALWLNVGVCVLGVSYVKWEKVQRRNAAAALADPHAAAGGSDDGRTQRA